MKQPQITPQPPIRCLISYSIAVANWFYESILQPQPETHPDSISEPLDSLLNLVKGRRSVSRPEEQGIMLDVVLGVEPTTTHDKRTLSNAGEKNLLFDFRDAFLGVMRVLFIGDLKPVLVGR